MAGKTRFVKRKSEYRRRAKPGTAPGTLVALDGASPAQISLFAYGPDGIQEQPKASVSDIRARLGKFPVLWVNVDGLADIPLLKEIGEIFGIHPLALEDVVNVYQRSKIEEYDDHRFIVTRMAQGMETGLDIEQVSLFLGENYVLTFQERTGDCLDPVRQRLRHGKGRIRGAGADYLAYAVLDTIVDGYFPVLEKFGDRVDGLEERIFLSPANDLIHKIHEAKHDLLQLRRAVWPQRDMVSTLSHDEFVSEENRFYFRDCQDHVIQVVDILESQRERLSGLTDLYLSSVSNRMNEVMKVLTIIATIFMPLSFIAGVYGMNFDNMPELHWRFGYFYALGLMFFCAVLFVFYFFRKGWLSSGKDQ